VAKTFGSGATIQREKRGGLYGDGQLLGFGDCLPCREHEHRRDKALQSLIGKRVSNSYLPDYSEPLVLRVVSGYQYDDFPAEQLEHFFGQEYRIAPDCDRVSAPLEGLPVKPSIKAGHPEGATLGAVEISPTGTTDNFVKRPGNTQYLPKAGLCLCTGYGAAGPTPL